MHLFWSWSRTGVDDVTPVAGSCPTPGLFGCIMLGLIIILSALHPYFRGNLPKLVSLDDVLVSETSDSDTTTYSRHPPLSVQCISSRSVQKAVIFMAAAIHILNCH